MPDLMVVDLSHWNTVKDFKAAAADGLLGVICKASEGTSYKDPTYEKYRADAIKAGLAFSSYHFVKHGNASAQMDWYLECACPDAGERVCLDYEDAACTLQDLYAAIDRLGALRPDLQITIYSGNLIKEQLGSKCDPVLAKTSLWLAQYTSGSPSWPSATWPYWSLWQYSDGSVGGSPRALSGISTPFDCNTFNGSRESCLAWLGPVSSTEPEPEPEPEPSLPGISLDVPPGMIVTINGVEFQAP